MRLSLESKRFDETSAGHWAHFCLYPSMVDVDSFLALGPWDPSEKEFVLDMASRCAAAEWKCDWLPLINYVLDH